MILNWKQIELIKVETAKDAKDKYVEIMKYLYADEDFFIEGEINMLFDEIFESLGKEE